MPDDPTVTQTQRAPLRVLVADDEESMRHFVQRGLLRLGHQVEAVDNGEDAVARFLGSPFDLAVLDLVMPRCDGLTALSRIRASAPDAIVVLVTAHGTVATAVEAMHLGAADFVTKPFTIDELWLRLDRALQLRATTRENRHLRAMLDAPDGGAGIVGQSQPMRELLRQLELLRESTATVLLTGESGTGKGLVAKALHLASPRSQQPFVALNCAAVPDTLVESELFGHEPGAFTGARTAKAGLLLRAHRGTVFLDEIADMSLPAQAKIERFLQEREFQPLGGQQPVRVDVRVIAATNRDLQALAKEGRFRAELLWRLDVVHLHVPPLRERREDVPLLIAQLLQKPARPGDAVRTMTPEAIGALTAYDWPGNVRELENVVERMVVMAGQRQALGVADLPPEVRGPGEQDPAAGDDYEAARTRFDRLYFTNLLMQCGGSITAAAQRAGLSRGHLHRRLRELGCDATAARAQSRTSRLDSAPGRPAGP
ncbi:MAG: sigma-54-dependent Fis family transcriptional regulator [Planctomycetes bacterium]|nr:sigma-54-dependent Fis family transcriptional regulator [Planctomycetota bacterium]